MAAILPATPSNSGSLPILFTLCKRGGAVAELGGSTGLLQGEKELLRRNHHLFSSFAKMGCWGVDATNNIPILGLEKPNRPTVLIRALCGRARASPCPTFLTPIASSVQGSAASDVCQEAPAPEQQDTAQTEKPW